MSEPVEAYNFSEAGEHSMNELFRKLNVDARNRGVSEEKFERILLPELTAAVNRVRRILQLPR